MPGRSWITVVLLCVIAALVGLLLVQPQMPAAHAQASEGRSENLIAVTSTLGGESLLYLIDTSREVVLVYGYHQPGRRTGGDVRSGAFEFLAGRMYRWDALLAAKQEYSIKGLKGLRGLRVEDVRKEVEKRER